MVRVTFRAMERVRVRVTLCLGYFGCCGLGLL